MLRTRWLFALLLLPLLPALLHAEPLPGTKDLTAEGDLAAQMVAGIDKYLMRELEASVEKRKQSWKPDFSSPEAYAKSVQPNRERLKRILGVVDTRVPFKELEYVSGSNTPALVAETDAYKVFAVRWPVLEGVEGDGLLLEPKGKVTVNVVAVPDADCTPEQFTGLAPGVLGGWQHARLLAERNCRVLVPTLIDRKDTHSGNPRLGRFTNQPHREFLYRMAYEMGRHVIGYEVQKVLAAVDWFCQDKDHAPVMVTGHTEGALVSMYAMAVDPRIRGAVIQGHFGQRERTWEQPIYRNVWGLLNEFGDAEILQLTAPGMVVETGEGMVEIEGPPAPRPGRGGAAPGRLHSLDNEAGDETTRFHKRYVPDLDRVFPNRRIYLYHDRDARNGIVSVLGYLLAENAPQAKATEPKDLRKDFDPAPRQKRQFDQLVAFTQKLLHDSEAVREKAVWSKLDRSSREAYEKSTEPIRKEFWEEVIGKLPAPTEPANPRTREIYDTPKWKGFEVMLDLYPDVYAYGILLVPKDMKEGEKRPVVVCQHGLEGRPQDVCNPKEKTRAYNSFGAQLADRGYIVYAPQNPYIGKDAFRVLQRKANPLKLSLFSFIVRQHERTLDWLATLPFADGDRIGFYGLSYGGKTAMRVPALLPRYKLSICSGDFNEWIAKNVSVDFRGSYMFSGEYEMPEFDLGQTFNYAEMAALIAPRPFMVERGHDDGVGTDEMVAYEYAKVRRLYAQIKLPERTTIEFFPSGHEIHGQGTFEFLDRYLKGK